MNRKELCCCKFCIPKCQKFVKNYKIRRICFKDQSRNKPLSQNIQHLKQQNRKCKVSKRNLNLNKAKRFTNHTLYKIFDENLNDTSFANGLRNFFIESKEDARKTWRKQDRSNKYAQQQKKSLKRNAEEYSRANIFDELFPDVTKEISSSVEIRPKLITSIPNVTQNYFHLEKMINHEQVTELLYKDLSLYKKKMPSNNFNRTLGKKEFITRWFKQGHEKKYKSLQTFSKVFRDLDDLATTKKFCAWLRNHPEIEPPSYLLEHGLLGQNESIGTSSIDINQKLWSNKNSYNKLDINYDYISNHFKLFKFSHNSSSKTESSSISNPFVSDVAIII